MHQGYILQCYDAQGFKYDLPPFVVNEPTSYGERRKEAIIPSSPGHPLSLVIRSSRRPDVPLNMTSNNTGKQLKFAYLTQVRVQGPLRLFFNGKELKDDGLLNRLEDGVVVQAMG